MKHVKLFEQFIAEGRNGVGKYNTVKKAMKAIRNEYGPTPTPQSVASFITDNYYDVTEVDREDDDPRADDKIADLIASYKFDLDEWEIAWEDAQNESVVTEAKNTIGLAFKEEQDYLDFVEFIKDEKGSIKKDFGWDSKTKSWEVIMDVKVLDRIYGEGTPGNKESGWYGGLPGDFESVIIESVGEALSKSDRKAIAYTMAEQDPSKIKDLQNAIGQDFSDNYSSTNRSILVDVKKKGGKWVAITKETESEYNNKKPKKGEREATIGITWNAMFY